MKLRFMGAQVLVISEGKRGESGAVPHGVDLKLLFRKLEKRGLKTILVEGGGELNWSLLRLGLVNELKVTVAPKIAGGRPRQHLSREMDLMKSLKAFSSS